MDVYDLYNFIVWFGSVAGAGVVTSFIFERWAYFQSLASESKKWVSFGGMALLGLSSHLVLTYVPADVLASMAPYFSILAASFVSVFSGNMFHKGDREEQAW